MARKDYKFTFHILVGLPGSGKTYFAENYFPNQHWKHLEKFHIDLDNCSKTGIFKNDVFNALDDKKYAMQEIYCRGHYNDVDICFDGLITTVEQIKSVMDVCLHYMKSYAFHLNYKVKFVIHKWNADRETCMLNDIKRVKDGVREHTSTISIENIPFDTFDINDFETYFDDRNICDIIIKPHTVKKITTYDTIFYPLVGEDRNEDYGGRWRNENKPAKTKYMYSENWSGGGTWGNCWGDTGEISGDNPAEFKEFDGLLERICPNITFLQYKKIHHECIDIETTYEHDYYGGSETIHRWRCDMEKLYQMLTELGIIKNE